MYREMGKRRGGGWLCIVAMIPASLPASVLGATPPTRAPVYIQGFRQDASGASFKNIVLTPAGCVFDYIQLGDEVRHWERPCQLVSSTAPIVQDTLRGAFSIRFDLPGGRVTQNFIVARPGDIRVDTSQPGPLAPFDLGDQLHFRSAPPYGLGDIQVAPLPPLPPAPPAPPSTSHNVYKLDQGANGAISYEYAGTATSAEVAALPPPPPAKPLMLPLHLHVDGFECSLRMEGKSAARCVVNGWSKDFVGIEVNGDALGLSQTLVSFMVTRDTSGDWVYRPFTPSKDVKSGSNFTLIAPTPAWDAAATMPDLMTNIFEAQSPHETVDVVLTGKHCAYRDTFTDFPFDKHFVVYPCEIIADRPSPHPTFFQDHDYGVLIPLPQGERYLKLLAMPNGPHLEGPSGVPELETTFTTGFNPRSLPPDTELDIPSDPPLHLSVSGLACNISAAGHGSFPCRVWPAGAESLSIDVNTLYFDPWAGGQRENFSLTHLLTGWVMGGDPKKMFHFGAPNPPETPATPRPHHPHPAPEPGKIEKKVLGPILEPLIGGLSGHYNPRPRPKPPSEPGVRDIALLGFQRGPMPGLVSYFGLQGAAFEGESVHVTNLRTGEYRDADVMYDGGFWVDVPGAIDDLYAISFDVPGKDGPHMYQRGDDPPLGLLQPSSVANNTSETMGDDIMSMGSYSGPADVGVVIGDQVATLDHGVFLANGVSLKPGNNIIPVTITALGGWKVTKRFTIKSKGKWPVRLIVSSDLGNPLTMNFSYGGVVALPLRKLTVASSWTDTPSLTLDDPAAGATLSHAYASHGLYPVQLRATDAQGVTYMVERPVLVPDPAEIDARARAAWRYFLAALASRDRQAVMSAVTTDGQKQLKNKVDDLLQGRDKLPGRGLPLVRETPAGHALTYVLGEPGSTLHVGFKQDSDGVWRIDSLD